MSVEFHPLRVVSVEPLTEDAVTVTFDVPENLVATYRYLPGQHVTLRAVIDGADVRRSYSICANASTGKLRVGIKRLAGGVFSTWATTRLKAGETIEVAAPVGDFVVEPDPSAAHHYAAIAAGSGITPVLSLISTTLELESGTRWTLVFGNRGVDSIMFFDEIQGLKDRYLDRFHLIHVLSRERPDLDLYAGRIDSDRLARLLDSVVDAATVERWFLCGPYDMVRDSRTVLESRGVEPERVLDELFFAGPPDASSVAALDEAEGTVELAIKLGGRTTETRMSPEFSILDSALRIRSELPFSCKGGMCASCKAKLVSGKVEMDKNYALVDSELEAGYVLTCQAHPVSDRVSVDYDV